MALVNCKECGKEVSDGAGKCQHCGAKVKKPTSILTWVAAGVFVLLVTQCVSSKNESDQKTAEKRHAEAAAEAAKSPEQKTAEARQKMEKELQFQKTAAAAAIVKKALRNPGSVVWDEIYANHDASVICLAYRAENGFGGTTKERVSITKDKASQSLEAWNKRCTGKGFTDLIHVRQAL